MAAILVVLAIAPALGHEVMVVRSGSMEPYAPTGSLVVARQVDPIDVQVGDVVVIRRHANGETKPAVMHRVIERTIVDGDVVVRTKGDANPKPDPELAVLRGKALTPIVTVPVAGRVFSAIRTPVGWFSLVVGPAVIVFALMLVQLWSPRRAEVADGDAPPQSPEQLGTPAALDVLATVRLPRLTPDRPAR